MINDASRNHLWVTRGSGPKNKNNKSENLFVDNYVMSQKFCELIKYFSPIINVFVVCNNTINNTEVHKE